MAAYIGIAGVAYLLLTASLIAETALRNGGKFIFPFDDPYIHAAMARNLVEHGVWGVSQVHYASASSAPAWTLLLAAAQLVHINPLTAAWLLNAVFGVALIALTALVTRIDRLEASGAVAAALGILVVGLVPVTAMGMEPVMFAVAVLAVTYLGERCATGPSPSRWAWLGLFVAAATMGATRFESLFVALGVAVGLLLNSLGHRGERRPWLRDVGTAAVVCVASALPVLVVGLINKAQGEFFLPNSVEAKTKLQSGILNSVFSVDGFNAILTRATSDPLLIAALATAAVGLVVSLRRNDTFALLASCGLIAAWFGMVLFGDTSLPRYVFYLYVLAVVISLRLVVKAGVELRRLGAWGLVAALCALSIPGIKLDVWVPRASHEIYRQQYQMARFIHANYDHAGVALNDIGAVSYLHHGDVLDLLGLGSFDVLEHIKAKTLTPDVINQLAGKHHVQIAAIYQEWFPNLPPSWQPVERWCFVRPFTWSVGSPCVTWMGVGNAAADLERRLAIFDLTLPPGVQVEHVSS